jgi:hypothetical protein
MVGGLVITLEVVKVSTVVLISTALILGVIIRLIHQILLHLGQPTEVIIVAASELHVWVGYLWRLIEPPHLWVRPIAVLLSIEMVVAILA